MEGLLITYLQRTPLSHSFIYRKQQRRFFFFQSEGQRAWGFLFACFSQMLCNFNEFKDEKNKTLAGSVLRGFYLMSTLLQNLSLCVMKKIKSLFYLSALFHPSILLLCLPDVFIFTKKSYSPYFTPEQLRSLLWDKFTPESKRQFKVFYAVILMIESFAQSMCIT